MIDDLDRAQFQAFALSTRAQVAIAIDEDHSTPIFPLCRPGDEVFVKPGDVVILGQPLFTVVATNMVQAQNEFISAVTTLNKARSALNLTQVNL